MACSPPPRMNQNHSQLFLTPLIYQSKVIIMVSQPTITTKNNTTNNIGVVYSVAVSDFTWWIWCNNHNGSVSVVSLNKNYYKYNSGKRDSLLGRSCRKIKCLITTSLDFLFALIVPEILPHWRCQIYYQSNELTGSKHHGRHDNSH